MDDREDERYRGASDASDGPLEGLLASELRELVAGAVARLPPLQREALILFDYEEFTLAEIAGVAGTDVGTIKSRLHRARERLRQELTGQLGAGTVHVARRGNT